MTFGLYTLYYFYFQIYYQAIKVIIPDKYRRSEKRQLNNVLPTPTNCVNWRFFSNDALAFSHVFIRQQTVCFFNLPSVEKQKKWKKYPSS